MAQSANDWHLFALIMLTPSASFCKRTWQVISAEQKLNNNSGREQSMKPMIGKSIDQSMTIDAVLLNWHRLASANRLPIDNHTKVVATHRLSKISDKKNSVFHTLQPRLYVHTPSQYAEMFEIWICSPDCLYAVAWFQKSTTETHFKTVFWRNTSQNHTFSLSCSSLSFMLLMSGSYELEL